MRFCVFGSLRVILDGTDIRIRGNRERTLLTALLLRCNQAISIQELIDILWPTHPPRTALQQVQNCMSSLRKTLSQGGSVPNLRRVGGSYVLSVDEDLVDAHVFRSAVEKARKLEATGLERAAADAFRNALDLWTGDLTSEVGTQRLRGEAAYLEELRVDSLERYIDLELQSGNHGAAVVVLNAAVAKHTFNERLHGQLMTALHASGRSAEALRVYRELGTRLARELGAQPAAPTQTIHREILASVQAGPVAEPAEAVRDSLDRAFVLMREMARLLESALLMLGGAERAHRARNKRACPGCAGPGDSR